MPNASRQVRLSMAVRYDVFMICPYQNDLNVTIANSARAVLFRMCLLNHCKCGRDSWLRVIFILIVETPQSGGQKIREARKPFPLRRGRGEAMSESGIQHKIFPDRIRHGPQIPDCVSAGEWLREMPEFAG